MLVPTCNPKPLLGFGSIEHRARRFCETIPRTRAGPSRKPDSALSRHPSPGPEAPGPLGAAPTNPTRGVSPPGHFGLLAPVVYLAGPSRDTAGGLLPHPFTHHLCRKATFRPSAGLLSVALDVAAGLRRRRPSGSWPERPLLRVRTLLCTPGDPGIQRRVGRPRPSLIIP